MLKVTELKEVGIELDNDNLIINNKYPYHMCKTPLASVSKDSVIGYYKNINIKDGIVLIDNLPDKANKKYNDPDNLRYLNALIMPTTSKT